MITVPEQSVKGFMNTLFLGSVFDDFEVREAVIASFLRFEISGELLEYEQKKYATWQVIKPFALSFIKGHKPASVRLVFSAAPNLAASIHPNAAALFLNMNYEKSSLRFTCAVSQKQFELNKELDQKWEEYIKAFFTKLNINAEFS